MDGTPLRSGRKALAQYRRTPTAEEPRDSPTVALDPVALDFGRPRRRCSPAAVGGALLLVGLVVGLAGGWAGAHFIQPSPNAPSPSPAPPVPMQAAKSTHDQKSGPKQPVRSAGCDLAESKWHDHQRLAITTPDGHVRRFRLRIHGSVGLAGQEPVPLVVVFHSYGYDADFAMKWSLWDKFASTQQQQMVLLYPDGLDDSIRTAAPGYPAAANGESNWTGPVRGWNSLGNSNNSNGTCDLREPLRNSSYGYYPGYRSCQSRNHTMREFDYWTHSASVDGKQERPISLTYLGAGQCDSGPCTDDVGFVKLMVEAAWANLCIDKRRVFATGQSNGGMMTEQLGLDRRTAGIFAAGVQVSGAPLEGFNEPPVAPFALMSFRGTNDSIIPFGHSAMNPATPRIGDKVVSSDGFFYVPEQQVMARWAEKHECEHPKHPKPYKTRFDGHGIGLHCHHFGECAHGSAVVSCRFEGGHTLPWNSCETDCLHDWVPQALEECWWPQLAFGFMMQHPKLHFDTY